MEIRLTDTERKALSHIAADGPVDVFSVADYIHAQCKDVDKFSARIARLAMTRLLREGMIARYDEDVPGELACYWITDAGRTALDID